MLTVVPLTLKQANGVVGHLHRHHKPVQGHRFSLGLLDEHGDIVGAVIAGRPVSRMYSPTEVLEVTRLVTDGTPNACSKLYQAAARTGKEMGFKRIQTYILESEPGTSLKAAGWTDDGEAGGGSWSRSNRERTDDQPLEKKRRWVRVLNG